MVVGGKIIPAGLDGGDNAAVGEIIALTVDWVVAVAAVADI